MLAGGNIFGQGGAAVTPVFNPTGSPTNGFPLFGAGGSAYGWRAMTSADVTTALGFTPISGLTINSTSVSGGATNALLYGDGTVLQNAAGITRTGPGFLTHTINNLGTTPSDASEFLNTTAAAVGAQQISPSIHWQGQGWKTAATAASQPVDVRCYVIPVQAAAAPNVTLDCDYSQNGGAFATLFTARWDGTLTRMLTGIYESGSNGYTIQPSSTGVQFSSNGLRQASGAYVGFQSGTTFQGIDTASTRCAAGIWCFGTTTTVGDVTGATQDTATGTVAVLTTNLKPCSAGGSTPTGVNSYAQAVSDATAPTLGVALTGGGTVWAHVHCSLTTGTYIVDGL